MPKISFSPAITIRENTKTALGTTETDLVVIKDNEQPLRKSQLSIYLSAILGSHTAVNFRYYVSMKVSPINSVEGSASDNTDWYLIPTRNQATGVLSDIPTSLTTLLKGVEDLGFSTCCAFKVTAQGVGGAGGTAYANVCARDN